MVATALPVEVLPWVELAMELVARLRATSLRRRSPRDSIARAATTVPATALVDCVPPTAPPEVEI